MDTDETLVDCASVDEASAQALGDAQPWDILKVWLATPSSLLSKEQHSAEAVDEVTSCVLQLVVADGTTVFTGDSNIEKLPTKPTMAIHPLMYEFLSTSFATVSESISDFDNSVDTEKNAAESTDRTSNSYESMASEKEGSAVSVSVTPLALFGDAFNISDSYDTDVVWQHSLDHGELPWMARRIPATWHKDLPPGSHVALAVVYLDDDLRAYCEEKSRNNSDVFHDTLQSLLASFLEKRILMKGTIVLISTVAGLALAVVKEVQCHTSSIVYENDSTGGGETGDEMVYRLGNTENYHLDIIYDDEIVNDMIDANQLDNSSGIAWQPDCPGYEKLAHTIRQMVSLKGSAAPSGILLTGSPQVGKTHLASCVAYRLSRASTNSAHVHWVSVQDLVMQASWASEADLLDILRPPSRGILSGSRDQHELQLLVIDDLHMFDTEASALQEDAISINLDPEMMVVRNSVLQIIDELASPLNDMSVAILGIAQSSSNLPADFVRSGRLEKEISMLPPTQSQRETILNSIIPTLTASTDNSDDPAKRWAKALSPVTVGCVAGDLCRVLAAAWTRATARGWSPGDEISCPDLQWDDLKRSAQTYVPIQLESVDVCKPETFWSLDQDGDESPLDSHGWARIHEQSWAPFAGYPLVKKRLLRTVVGPWRRFLASIDSEQQTGTSAPSGLSPPPGVLFYGASGNGKSFAATLLASSLGLPMIIVKAADVMDKWLGGSEAIIRSLFTRARSAAPCILFFDEIDAVATNRAGGDEGGAEVMSRLLSTLLNEMDGISSDKRKHSVLVLACTNRLEELDAALLRPGRLEEHVHLGHPDVRDITAMLQLHLSKVPVSDSIDLDALAQELAKYQVTGADVQGLFHEACLNAIHRSNSKGVFLLPEDIQLAIQSSRLP